MEVEPQYMARALQLALNGAGYASPNPMVGAVVVADGRIIGEGWHRVCGQGHAEVNAIASVRERHLLPQSTIYVTLEPCAHYGKTPPCAKLIIDTGIPRVVVGCMDPFEKVSGKGVQMLRDAGIEVVTGVMEPECRALNRVFITAHTRKRPYVVLKWACSSDGYMDAVRRAGSGAVKFSSPLGSAFVHMMRSRYDAIMVGSGTVMADDCRLDVRHVYGRTPLKVVLDRRSRIPLDAAVFREGKVLYVTVGERVGLPENVERLCVPSGCGIREVLGLLYARGITSVMVEGGASLANNLIDESLWDEIRMEIAPFSLGASGRGHIILPQCDLRNVLRIDDNVIINCDYSSPDVP